MRQFCPGVLVGAILLAPGLWAATPTRADRLFASGWKAFEEGRLEDARSSLLEAARLDPGNPTFAMALGQCYLRLGETKLAIPQLNKAVTAMPGDFALLTAREALVDRPIDEAPVHLDDLELLLEELQELHGVVLLLPPPAPLLGAWNFTHGFSLFRLGRIDAAEKIFRALLNEDGMRAPANFFLGNCFFARNQFDQAVASYELAIVHGNVPDNKALNAYYYNDGLALFQLHRFEDAARAFRRSIERYSRDPLPWLFLGRCETELKHFPEAIQAYEAAIENGPEFRLAYYQLARLHSEHGDPKRAEALFRKTAELRQQQLEKEEELARRLKLGSR